FATFADRIGDFAGLSESDSDFPALIAHNHQRAEIEASSTFYHFGGAIDEHDLLDQLLSVAPEIHFARVASGTAPASAWTATATGLLLLTAGAGAGGAGAGSGAFYFIW